MKGSVAQEALDVEVGIEGCLDDSDTDMSFCRVFFCLLQSFCAIKTMGKSDNTVQL